MTPDKDIDIHCQSGVRSAHTLVTLYLVGYSLEKLRNYDGSWIEWSRSEEHIEIGPPGADPKKVDEEGLRARSRVLMMIRIPTSIYEAMIEHAKRESPLECCGILAGHNGTVLKAFEVRNEEQSPVRYSLSPKDQLRVFEEIESEAMEMVAIYHSHTHTIPFPSETDVRLAFYPEVASVIISLKDERPLVKAFKISEDAIYPEEVDVV